MFMENFKDFLRESLNFVSADWLEFCVAAVVMVLVVFAALALAYIFRLVFAGLARRFLENKNPQLSSIIKKFRLVEKLSGFLPAVMILAMMPLAFQSGEKGAEIAAKLCLIWIIAMGASFANALLSAANEIFARKKTRGGGNYVKGFVQVLQVVVVFIAAIIMAGILLGRSPLGLLTGLGASAAILMLVFKDTILGFVAGIQLSANDMLKVGDWITMKKCGADGVVQEVNLNAVKVLNFDNTTITIPPYALVTDAFQNWRTMATSGGRRIMRSILIDQQSVKFCEPKDIESLAENPHTRAFFAAMKSRQNIPATNLGLFRAYALFAIESFPKANLGFTYMVRELEPTSAGLPVQFYFFANTVEWVAYENIQADFMDAAIAAAPLFGLRIFQIESDNI